MSLVEEFFKQYDELSGRYGKESNIFRSQDADRPEIVAAQISLYKL